jgi:hypothetical protein
MTAKRFTLLRLLLLTLHVAMLLHSHAFSLPYVDHPDEPAFYLAGQVWLGKFEMGSYMRGYPPAYIALELIVAQLLGWLGLPEMSQTVNVMRWIAVAVSGRHVVAHLQRGARSGRRLGIAGGRRGMDQLTVCGLARRLRDA